MKVVIIASEKQQAEWSGWMKPGAHEVEWISSIDSLKGLSWPDVCIDLLFEAEQGRIEQLHSLQGALVIVNSVVVPLKDIHPDFVRINGWPGFTKANLLEATANNTTARVKARLCFEGFGKQLQWVDDIPGLITPRVISMIINEAYLALDEGISTKEEIDIAMQLGTSYPHGPFAWAKQIGLRRIVTLLEALSEEHIRYAPSRLLLEEAENSEIV